MRLLFVCTGNICRSPTAHGMMEHMLRQAGLNGVEVASAGLASYHVGEAPDPRSQQAARALGYDISHLRARRFSAADFDTYNLILAMDEGHLAGLQRQQPKTNTAQVRLFLNEASVPDPYYDGPQAFAQVARMIETGCQSLLNDLQKTSVLR